MSWDPHWERIFSSREWGKYPPEHIVRFVARNFYSQRQARLLEIGCGPGANIWFMAREGFTVSGIDGSSSAIDIARARLSKEGLTADIRVGDFTSLPWEDNSFDGVVENVSLCCNPSASIMLALTEVRRVLKPGGMFFSSFFTDRTWGCGLGTEVEPGGFIEITEGPASEIGFCLFVNHSRVEQLFSEFSDVTIGRVLWSLDSEHCMEQFLVTCRNP